MLLEGAPAGWYMTNHMDHVEGDQVERVRLSMRIWLDGVSMS